MKDDKPFTTGGQEMKLPWDEVMKAITFWLNERVFSEPVTMDAIDIWKEPYDDRARGLSIEFSVPQPPGDDDAVSGGGTP